MKPSTRGTKRFIHDLLDDADRNDMRVKQEWDLRKYSKAEQADVAAQLQVRHVSNRVTGLVVLTNRWIDESYGGNKEAFLMEHYAAADRNPNNWRRQHREATETLVEALEGLEGDAEARARLVMDTRRGRGWIGVSFRREGHDATLIRAEAFLKLTEALPIEEELPLRSWCSRVTGNSHILDDDTILRNAVKNYVVETWPTDDDDDSSWEQAGILTSHGRGAARMYGCIILNVHGTLLDGEALAKWGHELLATRNLLRDARISHTPSQVLFVENPSTFIELQPHCPPHGLLVLTDGYPNRATQELARMLHAKGLRIRHWGDIDIGGFRILRGLGDAHSVLMDPAAVELARKTPWNGKRSAFESRAKDVSGIEKEALTACLEQGGWVEQEAFNILEIKHLLWSQF